MACARQHESRPGPSMPLTSWGRVHSQRRLVKQLAAGKALVDTAYMYMYMYTLPKYKHAGVISNCPARLTC